jgi:ESCRT-I complex subunit VPS28
VANGKEVKLHNGTPAQRRVWDDLATIYSIIVSVEFVEKAYVRDTISQAQYPPPLAAAVLLEKTDLGDTRKNVRIY